MLIKSNANAIFNILNINSVENKNDNGIQWKKKIAYMTA